MSHSIYALNKAGVINLVMELYRPLKKTKALPLPLSLDCDDWPYAALIPSERCAVVRASIVAGVGKVKPEFRDALLELHAWLGEVGDRGVLALFCY